MSESVNQFRGENGDSGNDSMVVSEECLKNILKYLPDDDLLKVIEDDNRLVSVARKIFKGKSSFGTTVTNKYDPIHEEISSSVKLLSYFGCEIDRLVISYLSEYRQFDHILDEAIVAHCHKSLQHITFNNATQFSMFAINEPFEQVHTVEIMNGEICAPVLDFAKLFPNANRLDMSMLHINEPAEDDLFTKCCPNLERISIHQLHSVDFEVGYLGNIAKLITSTTQLKKLEITEQEHTVRLLALVSAEMPKCPELEIIVNEAPNASDVLSSHFEELKTLKLVEIYDESEQFRVSVDHVENLIFDNFDVTEHWLKSIEKNTKAKTIILDGEWANDDIAVQFVDKVKISADLELLMCGKLAVDQIVELATHFKKLKHFYVRGHEDDRPQMENALELLEAASEGEWQLKFHCPDDDLEFFGGSYCWYYGFEKN